MDIRLSKRLTVVANQVKYRTIADIGTDHAYVPIYLCNTNKIDKGFACDINKGPLEKANINIRNYNFENKITTLLSNGLSKIFPDQVETIIISGMGGKLTIDILNNNLETVKSLKQLVLQPQLDVYDVRKYIHNIGFCIENEEMILEEGKYYNIISAVASYEKYTKETDYIFGKVLMENKNQVLKSYIDNKIKKYNQVINNLNLNNTLFTNKRKEQLLNELNLFEEVYKWL